MSLNRTDSCKFFIQLITILTCTAWLIFGCADLDHTFILSSIEIHANRQCRSGAVKSSSARCICACAITKIASFFAQISAKFGGNFWSFGSHFIKAIVHLLISYISEMHSTRFFRICAKRTRLRLVLFSHSKETRATHFC